MNSGPRALAARPVALMLFAAQSCGFQSAAAGEDVEHPGSYVVPVGCPARSAWLSAVRDRLPPLLRTHPLLADLSVHVETRPDLEREAYAAELGGAAAPSASSRRVYGESCDEVLDALSFMAALSLERLASRPPENSSSPTMPASLEQPAVRETEASAAGADASGLGSASPVTSNLRWGATALAIVQDGLTPASSVAWGLAVRLHWSAASYEPVLLLGLYSSVPTEHSSGVAARVRYEHWSSQVVACPWRLPTVGAFGLRPCVELDIGRSSGEGVGVPDATRRSAPWLAGGVALRAELELFERIELSASLAGVVPFWRAHFFLRPDLASFDTPVFGLRAGTSLSVLF